MSADRLSIDSPRPKALERRGAQMAARERQLSLRALYGSALPAKAALDAQILGRFQRLPGGATPSAMLGMQAVSGELDDCGLAEHFGGDFAVKEMGSGDLHGQMETQLRMRKDGRPL